MRISDWSSEVCSSDLSAGYAHIDGRFDADQDGAVDTDLDGANISPDRLNLAAAYANGPVSARVQTQFYLARSFRGPGRDPRNDFEGYNLTDAFVRSDEHTSELQSLMRISYAVFCLNKNKQTANTITP